MTGALLQHSGREFVPGIISSDGRAVNAEYLVGGDDSLCCILDIDSEEIVAIVNLRWGRESVERHVMAHLDYGVRGVVICIPGCSVGGQGG